MCADRNSRTLVPIDWRCLWWLTHVPHIAMRRCPGKGRTCIRVHRYLQNHVHNRYQCGNVCILQISRSVMRTRVLMQMALQDPTGECVRKLCYRIANLVVFVFAFFQISHAAAPLLLNSNVGECVTATTKVVGCND